MTGQPEQPQARSRAVTRWTAAWLDALTAPGPAPSATWVEPAALARKLAKATASGLADPADPARADEAGQVIASLLTDARLTGPETLRRLVRVLGTAGPSIAPDAAAALVSLTSAAAARHAAASRELLLEQQESIHQAALTTLLDAERALFASEARFRAVFADAAIGIGIGDLEGQILDVNHALEDMLGYSVDEFRRRRVHEFVHPDDVSEIWQGYQDLIAGRIDAFRAEKRYRHRSGHTIWTHLTVSLIRSGDGTPTYQLAMIEDVTGRRHLTDELRHAASHDSLTGLPNRERFLEELDAALSSTARDAEVGVCFLDIDGFKMINDTWGHLVGDQVLVAVADRLAPVALGVGASLARLAGDEFVVLTTHGTSIADQTKLGESLLAALDAPIPVAPGEDLTVRASVGAVAMAAGQTTAKELLRAADLALHAAKEEGKGRVVAHDPDRTERQITRFGVAMSLPGVVERDELSLVYQPMVRLGDGGLHGVEALLRWPHPRLGQLPPELFVGVAEESSAIVVIGRWVLAQACRDLAAHDRGLRVQGEPSGRDWPLVAVNVSVRQLYSSAFVDDVAQILAETGIAAQRLRLEVTEGVIMHLGHPGPLATLAGVAELGVGIVMDDFGTSYSNLAALRRLPLTELKLAGSFIDALSSQPPDALDVHFLTTIVDLAHAMGLLVTAEGIETVQQDEQIRRIGCDVAQGWLYGQPRAAAIS